MSETETAAEAAPEAEVPPPPVVRLAGCDLPGHLLAWFGEMDVPSLLAADDPRLDGIDLTVEPFVPPPAPVPVEVPLRNILFALRDGGWISHAEALAAAKTGDMPAALTDTLRAAAAGGALTQGDVDDAELTWAAMYTAVRANPMWNLFVAAGRATPAQVDDLFRAAAAIP